MRRQCSVSLCVHVIPRLPPSLAARQSTGGGVWGGGIARGSLTIKLDKSLKD